MEIDWVYWELKIKKLNDGYFRNGVYWDKSVGLLVINFRHIAFAGTRQQKGHLIVEPIINPARPEPISVARQLVQKSSLNSRPIQSFILLLNISNQS